MTTKRQKQQSEKVRWRNAHGQEFLDLNRSRSDTLASLKKGFEEAKAMLEQMKKDPKTDPLKLKRQQERYDNLKGTLDRAGVEY